MASRTLTHLKPGCSAIGRAIAANVEELMVAAAIALIAAGLRDVWAPGAYIVPGLVLLWIYLPARTAFVVSKPDDKKGRT